MYISKIEELFRQHAPKSYAMFRSWVGDNWLPLLEIIGYVLWAGPAYRPILLVGHKPAWLMYMRLLMDILGPDNVSHIPFEDLADSNSNAAALLYRKLANIYPDMPKYPQITAKRFAELLGDVPLCVYSAKHGREICFVNRAKLIFGSEELPEPLVEIVGKDFPRFSSSSSFPKSLDEIFYWFWVYQNTFTDQEIESLIPLGMAAFVKAMHRWLSV